VDTVTAGIRPHDQVKGARVVWRSPVGPMRGLRVGTDPRQRHTIPGADTHGDPHSWFVLLVDEDVWFAHTYRGDRIGPDEARWAALQDVTID
jgi:hypothetical protein